MSFTQGVFAKHAQQILAEEAEYGVANTALAYGTKKKEFIGYCNHQFPQQADSLFSSTTVTEGKIFGFLYYQSRRSKQKRGKNITLLAFLM